MERNNDLPTGGAGGGGSTGGGGGYGDTGDFTGTQGYGAGTGASAGSSIGGSSSSDQGHGQALSDRARDLAGNAQEKLADVGGTVREKAGQAKNSLVGALEAGADRLRQRAQGSGGSAQFATATGDGSSVGVAEQGRLAPVADKVATGMQATADWLRDADLDNLKSGIERQVKEHPGRTLLIALGLGYVIGKAFRK